MAEYTLNIIVSGDGSGVAQLVSEIDGLGEQANQAGVKVGTGLSGINPAAQIVIGAFREIGAVAINALGAAAGAIGGFLKDSVSLAGDFEAGMNTFAAAAGDGLAEAGLSVDDFRNKFLEIGAALPVSTSAVQEAATTLIKGGLDPLVVKMGGLESSIKFAAAAGMDLNAAAELSIKQLGTFVPITASAAEQTQFLADSQDLLVKAAGASTLDVDKLGAAMLSAGGTAQAAGVDYQDFVTTMGMISPSFDSAATAGTSYKNFLTRLQPTTASAMSAMRDLNLVTADGKSKFFDSTGAFVGNREAAAMLQKSLAGLSDAQRTAALQAMFGNDAMGAAVALANNGAAGYDKFAAAMLKASGVEATAKTVQQGFNIALDNMHGSVEALQIVVGTALLPVLTAFLNGVLSPGINLVTQFALAMVSGGDALAGLPPILQSVVGFFEALWNAEGALETAFVSAGTTSLAFGQALDQLGAAFGLPMGLLSGLSFAIQDFLGVLYSAGSAIAAFFMSTGSSMDVLSLAISLVSTFGMTIGGILTDAAIVIRNYMQVWIDLGATIFNVASALISGDLAGAWTALTTGFAQVVTDYQTYAASFAALLWNLATTIGQAVLTWGAALVDWIAPYIPIALAALTTWVTSIYAWIVSQAPIWMAQLAAWGQALADWATPYLSLAITTLSTWLAGLWAWVQQQAPGWVAQLMAWGQALADWVAPAIPLVLAALMNLGTSIYAWIGAQASALVAAFTPWANSLIAWIPGATVAFLGAWPGMLGSFLDWIAGAVGPILAQLGTWAIAFVQWIVPMIPPFLAGLGAVLGALVAFIVETAVVLVAKLATWGLAFLGWIAANVLPALPGLLATILNGILSFIAGAVAGIAVGVAGWAVAIVSWVKEAISKTPGALAGLLATIISSITGMNAGIVSQAMSLGGNIIDGIMKGLSGAASRLSSALKDMATGALNAAKSALGISSPSKVFAKEVGVQIPAGIGAGVAAGMPKLEKNLINGIAGLSEAAAKALESGAKAISAAASYSGPSGSGITGFLSAFADLAIHFNDAAIALGGRILGTATRFADTIGKVAGGIGPAIESLTKLADFVAPSQAAIDEFGRGMSAVLIMLNNVGMSFDAQAWKAAVIFAEAAGKIIGMVGGAVDSLTKLAGFSGVSEKAIGAFGTAFNRVIGIVGWIAQQFLASSIAAAAVFAEGAGKITAMIGPAVDSFVKLAGFTGVSEAAIGAFATVFKRVIGIFGWIAQQFLASSIAAAAVFAEGAGTMLDMIGSTVETFTKLAAFSGTPLRAINLFGSALRATVTLLIAIGRTFAAEAVAAAGVFGDGAGKAVAFIGGAVESFKKLSEFVAPTQGAIGSFGLALSAALRMLTQVMRAFTTEAVAAAGVFGTEAGKAVGFIGNAVGSFLKLTEFVAPSMGAIGSFGIALSATLRMLIQTMQAFAAEAIAAAGAFGDGAGKAVAFIGNAVGGLIKLGEFTGIGQKAIDAFGLGLHATLVALVAMTRTFAAEAIAAAAVFGEGVGKAIGFIGNAVESFTKLSDVEQIPVAAIEVFAANIVIVIGRIVQLAGVVSAASVAQAAAFAANVAAVVKSVQDALSTFATLGDAKVGSDVLKQFMAATQALVAQMQAYLPPSANTIGQNTMIGMMNGIVAQRSNLVATMVNTVMAAVMAARAALGIASPSKVFAALGQNTGLSMASSMTATQPAVAQAGAGLGLAAASGAAVNVARSGMPNATTNNNQRSVNIVFEAGAFSGNVADPRGLATDVAAEIQRRLSLQGV